MVTNPMECFRKTETPRLVELKKRVAKSVSRSCEVWRGTLEPLN